MNSQLLTALLENKRDFTRVEMEPRVNRLFKRFEECSVLEHIQRMCQRDKAVLVICLSAQSVRDNLNHKKFMETIISHCSFQPQKDFLEYTRSMGVDVNFPDNALWIMCTVVLNRDASCPEFANMFTYIVPTCGCCKKYVPNKGTRVMCHSCVLQYYCSEGCRIMDKKDHLKVCANMKEAFSKKLF